MRVIVTAASLAALSSLAQLVPPASIAAQEARAGASSPAAAAPLTLAQLDELRSTLERHIRQERGRLASLHRQVDVATLHFRLGDVAHVDEVRFFGPPYESSTEPRSITAFVFVPQRVEGRGALLVWQRGSGELELESWSDVPELRELLGRGVTVIAPTYAGGPEERLAAVPEYALDRYPFLDRERVEWRAPS